MTTIRVAPDKDLIRVLTALGIKWDLALSGNGEGGWAMVELDDDADRRLLAVWDRLTDLRFHYVDYCQRSQAIQLALPMIEEEIDRRKG